MQQLIIGVGGNGVHSVLAFLRLSRLLHEPFPKPFRPSGGNYGEVLAIDGDTKHMEEGLLWPNFTKVYEYEKDGYLIEPTIRGSQRAESFRDLFQGPGDDLLRLVFEDQQLALCVYDGFYGQPAVGATTFHHKIKKDIETATANSLEDHLMNCIRGNTIRRVLFVSSCIGGTGAGVVPALARYLRAQGLACPFVYLSHIKWFNLGNAPDTVDDNRVKKNAAAGISFLFKEKDLFNRIVILDYDNPVPREADGGSNQKENYDLNYLLAGFLIRGMYRLDPDYLFEGDKIRFLQFDLDLHAAARAKDKISEKKRFEYSIYSRLLVQEQYKKEEALFSRLEPSPINSLYEHIKKAYKVYFYIRYFTDYLESRSWNMTVNPVPDRTERLLKGRDDEVKNAIKGEADRIENSLNWLERLKFPDILRNYQWLPFESYQKISEMSFPEKAVFLEKEAGIDVKEMAKGLAIEGRDIPNELIIKFWEAA